MISIPGKGEEKRERRTEHCNKIKAGMHHVAEYSWDDVVISLLVHEEMQWQIKLEMAGCDQNPTKEPGLDFMESEVKESNLSV